MWLVLIVTIVVVGVMLVLDVSIGSIGFVRDKRVGIEGESVCFLAYS